jgi:hypothetical protein
MGDDALGEAISSLSGLESRAAALRSALSAEADRRRVAEQTADTGTDAWLARLTGTTREQMAGGPRIAALLQNKYAETREAFAAGDLRVEQVRVIVNAAEQAPVEATPDQVAQAEGWLVSKATGAGTRSGRGMDAKRLRQAARRMFATIDYDLADRHEAILLGREARTAESETYLALHDNGDGSYTGKFRIPELHGHLLKSALDRLTAPRRLGRDRHGDLVHDESALGHNNGASVYEVQGAAWCELIEHLPTQGWPATAATAARSWSRSTSKHSPPASVPPGSTPGSPSRPAKPAAWPVTPGWSPPSSTATRCPWTSVARAACTAATSVAPWP